MSIVIVGAGIGGLTAALSLHAAGRSDVVVLEAAREIDLRPLLLVLATVLFVLDGLAMAFLTRALPRLGTEKIDKVTLRGRYREEYQAEMAA